MAGRSDGICLGLRILDEPGPKSPDRGSALVKVDYSEDGWRSSMTEHFRQVCALLQNAQSTRHNLELGLSALYPIAAFGSIGAKQEKWSVEQEYRNVTLVPSVSWRSRKRVA